MLLEAVLADLCEVVLRHDEAGGAGGRAVEGHEVGPRRLEMKAHHPGIDDLHSRDAVVQDLGGRALVALEAELHVVRGQWIAVVEFQSWPQLELVIEAVLTLLPGFCEARAHLVPGVRTHERVVERVEHAERRDLRRRGGRVEPARRNRDVPRHDGTSGRRRFAGHSEGGAEGDNSAEQQPGEGPAPAEDFVPRDARRCGEAHGHTPGRCPAAGAHIVLPVSISSIDEDCYSVWLPRGIPVCGSDPLEPPFKRTSFGSCNYDNERDSAR